MIPPILQQHLASLRQRERMLELVWGLSRLIAVVLGTVLVACLVDYVADRYDETPRWLRWLMMLLVVGLGVVAAGWFVLWPLKRKLGDEELALWVEERHPRLHHRLISAVQLNREGAIVEGMSIELIEVVTKEAEQHSVKIPFAATADHGRLKRSAFIAIPVLLVCAGLVLAQPQLSGILLNRLFLGDQAIPRRVSVSNHSKEIWPQGEKVLLEVRARGHNDQDRGSLVVDQEGIRDRYALESKETDPATGDTIYHVEIPASTADFTFQAYVGDGRLKTLGTIHFEPRPIVVEQHAWTRLPPYVDPKPNGFPYEVEQPRGEVVGISQSSVRVKAKIQKPVDWVALDLLGSDEPTSQDENRKPEKLIRTIKPMTVLHPVWHVDQNVLPMAVAANVLGNLGQMDNLFVAVLPVAAARKPLPSDGTWVQAIFDLKPEEQAYRLVASDKYGFTNDPAPRRALRIIPEEPPVVSLLREQFGPLAGLVGLDTDDDFDLEGLPVPPGGPLRIAYAATGQYGIGRARLMYRVLKKRESGNEEVDEKWFEYPLTEFRAGKGVGLFDPRRGTFEFGKGNVEFHAVPSFDPLHVLGRTLGGGLFDFQTKALVDGKGGFTSTKEGDQIEYYIEVFADRDPAKNRPSAKSETRIKNVVSTTDLVNWLRDTVNEERRVRQLNSRQEDVFPMRK